MQRKVISITRQLTNAAIKNSEIIQPYVQPKYYRRGLIVLNVLHWVLHRAYK